jgi:hypothetical protein
MMTGITLVFFGMMAALSRMRARLYFKMYDNCWLVLGKQHQSLTIGLSAKYDAGAISAGG